MSLFVSRYGVFIFYKENYIRPKEITDQLEQTRVSQRLLSKNRHNKLINRVSHHLPPLTLMSRLIQTTRNDATNHHKDYISQF